MVKVPVVDHALCTGCGTCEALCPKVFKLVDDKSTVIDENGCESAGCCEEAAESCPVEAISFEER